MYYTIYKITNIVNNKIYIGKHQTEDLDDGYMGSGLVLKYAIEKYGIDKFDKEILYVFDNEEQMNNMEKEIVNEEFLLREDVYNLNEGGNGGWNYINKSEKSLDYKRKGGIVSGYKTLTDKKGIHSPNCVKNLQSFLGKHHSKESKEKIGSANSKHQTGKNNSNYGNCWIHNNKQKISKLIKKEDLQKWLDDGWIKGRKIIFNGDD